MKATETTTGKATDGQGAGRVFLKRDKAGNWRAKWYGRFMRNGKTRETSLCNWQGTPPANPAKDEGNAAFERSRERAAQMLKDAMDKRNDADDEIRDARKVYALMYGHRIDRVKLADLWPRWNALPHKADLSEGHRDLVHCVLRRFVEFMGDRFPAIKDAGALTADHFKAFFDFVDGLGFSPRAWNYHLTILRGVLAKVDGVSAGFRDYLSKLPKRAETTVHRRPFSGGELQTVFDAAARVDPELRPVIVAAACTALRRGDAATLKWDSVDLADGFVTVKTTKTGETVEIPVFPPFMAVLREAERTRKKGVPYVFPKIALAYKAEPCALDRRLRKVLAAAGFVRPGQAVGKYPAPPTPADAVAMVEAGARAEGWTAKRREKALAILERYLNGQDGRTIAREMRISTGSVSGHLHAMEEAAKIALVTPPKVDNPEKSTLAEVKDGEQRKHRGSLCGWHSFRTTFCTLALENGVPMEILCKITGHKTVEIVLKHYDRRGRAAMRKAIGAAMPKAIAGTAEPGTPIDGEELVAVPVEVARVAEMLAGADAATLAKVAELVKKGGAK